MNIKKVALWMGIIIIGIILGYVWYGFLFPDTFYVSNFSFSGRLRYLWFPRIFIPVLYLVLLILMLLKNRKIAQNIFVTIITFLVIGLIAYPILDIKHFSDSKKYNNNISEQYHPYLQLNPPLMQRMDSVNIKSTFTIFCLGGSTTEFKDSKGIGWPDRLEKELRLYYGSDSIFVLNFGRQWYTTLHSLINYEVNLRHYKPNVIILMHNYNDLLLNADFSYLSKGLFREDYGHFMGPSKNILKNTGLFGDIWTNFKNIWHFKPRITFDQDLFPGLESFTRNINTLIDLASLHNTKVVLLSQPNLYSEKMEEEVKKACTMVNFGAVGKDKKWGYATAIAGMKQYNARVKAISENRNVYFIDLEKYLPKSLIHFTDEVHYTDTSFNIISGAISEEIIKQKIIMN